MPKLSCGGRGPCCHIGYSHRHCEHCDTVIPTSVYPINPWYQQIPFYPTWIGTAGTGTGYSFRTDPTAAWVQN